MNRNYRLALLIGALFLGSLIFSGGGLFVDRLTATLFPIFSAGSTPNPLVQSPTQSPEDIQAEIKRLEAENKQLEEQIRTRLGQRVAPAAPTTSAAPQKKPTLQDLKDSTTYIVVNEPKERSFGSGVTLRCDPNTNQSGKYTCYILTVAHLFTGVDPKAKYENTFFKNNIKTGTYALTLIAADKDLDLALVKIITDKPLPAVRMAAADYRARVGGLVVQIGCPGGVTPPCELPSQPKITAINRFLGAPTVECSGQPKEGRSGGPLFDTDGLLIGICSARSPTDQRGIYSSWQAIDIFLKKIGYGTLPYR